MESKAGKSLQQLLRVVRESQDTFAVRSAIMDLGYESGDEIYRVLVEKLNDPNPGIQHAAVISLGRHGRMEAVQEIIKPKIFRSPATDIRWAAVAAVGRLGDYRVIDCLLKAVDDPEWIVRNQAATELMAKVQVVRERRDPGQIHVLIHMLSLENEEIVGLAVEGLREFGPESLAPLRQALSSSSATIRSNAARALGRLASSESVPCLLNSLQDHDWHVRASAAEALGAVEDPASIEPLVQMMHDNIAKVQEQASAALIRFGKQATFPLLNALARARNKFVLRAILLTLGRITDPSSMSAIINHLRSTYFFVRQAAVAALCRFGPGVVDPLLPTLSFNTSEIDTLIKDARNRRRPERQIRAIKAMGGLEEHRATLVLKRLVDEGMPEVQEAAMQALFQIGCAAWGRCCAVKVLEEVGDASMASRLMPSLQDDSDNVRFEAVRALGKWGGTEAVQSLAQVAVKDRADFIRAEAIRVLRTIGGGRQEAIDAALRGLRDKSREVRAPSASLLGLFQNERSVLPLLKAMSDPDKSVRDRAENALLNFGSSAIRPLIAALGNPHPEVRLCSARLLGDIGDHSAATALQKLLSRRGGRNGLREQAAASLHKLQDKLT